MQIVIKNNAQKIYEMIQDLKNEKFFSFLKKNLGKAFEVNTQYLYDNKFMIHPNNETMFVASGFVDKVIDDFRINRCNCDSCGEHYSIFLDACPVCKGQHSTKLLFQPIICRNITFKIDIHSRDYEIKVSFPERTITGKGENFIEAGQDLFNKLEESWMVEVFDMISKPHRNRHPLLNDLGNMIFNLRAGL